MIERGGKAPWRWSRRAEAADTTLLLVGDTNVQNRSEPATAFKHVMATLHDADVLFGQLEGPLSPPSQDPASPDIPHKDRWRHSDPRMVDAFTAARFAALACASNVCYPPAAALASIATLRGAGIGHCGAGADLSAARAPAIVDRPQATFAFLSYTSVFWHVGHAATATRPGCATIKVHTGYQPDRRALEMPGAPPLVLTVPDADALAAMEADVRAAKDRADIVVVSCHWGVSGSPDIVDYQRTVGHAALRAGADIVFGHHPHVVQGVEFHIGKPVFYSLGNFAFDWEKMRGRALDGLAVRILVRNRRIDDIAIVPVRRGADNLVAILDPNGAGREVVETLSQRCAPFGTRVVVRDGDVTVAVDQDAVDAA
ncbi:MAG: CapA family protein [Inquilinaceae bacterium]